MSGVLSDGDRAEEDSEIRKREDSGHGAGDIDVAQTTVEVTIMPPLHMMCHSVQCALSLT